ncbi:MAG: protein TolR [Thermodesulfobacteriota bacterium]|nr:protein TolR [Thermodesulfobacteriota bacterium]
MDTKKNNFSFMSEINVTPLVDVMLVLLIIFMITANMMQQGVDVNLPETEKAKSLNKKEDTIILTINTKKEVFIDEAKVNLKQLKVKLSKIIENRENRDIFLKADKEIPYGFVVKVMAEIKDAGIKKLGMVTDAL